MKRIRIVGLCLVAVFAVSAVASASAVAGPEIVLKAGKSFPIKYDSTGGVSTLESKNGLAVTCTDLTNKGEFTDAHLGSVTITFLGCTGKALGVTEPCTTSGQASGIIVVAANTHIGYIKEATPTEVGVLFNSASKPLTSFSCTALIKIEVEGEVIGKITPINIFTETFEVSLKQKGSVQEIKEITLPLSAKPTELMTGVHLTSKLNTGSFEESGQESTDKITLLPAGETAELKA